MKAPIERVKPHPASIWRLGGRGRIGVNRGIAHPRAVGAASRLKAAQPGVRILIEKLLASSLADCNAVRDAARKRGRRIGTVAQRRFSALSVSPILSDPLDQLRLAKSGL